jgi:hypothetical protein
MTIKLLGVFAQDFRQSCCSGRKPVLLPDESKRAYSLAFTCETTTTHALHAPASIARSGGYLL